LRRAGIRLGGGAARLPAGEALHLVGRLPRLSVSEWQGLQEAKGLGDVGLPPLEVDLAFGELELYRRLLRDLGLRLRQQGAEWRAELSGHGAQGQARLRNGTQGLEWLSLDLDYLRIVR